MSSDADDAAVAATVPERLRTVKAQPDPEDVIRANHPVEPAS